MNQIHNCTIFNISDPLRTTIGMLLVKCIPASWLATVYHIIIQFCVFIACMSIIKIILTALLYCSLLRYFCWLYTRNWFHMGYYMAQYTTRFNQYSAMSRNGGFWWVNMAMQYYRSWPLQLVLLMIKNLNPIRECYSILWQWWPMEWNKCLKLCLMWICWAWASLGKVWTWQT